MATRDGLAQIWYADANGVITGYTPTADNVASAIIDAYNEHYGTVINIWTPETKTLQVGGTVPNWNAYEKIEITIEKVIIEDGKYYLISLDFNNPQSNYMLGVASEDGDNFALEPSEDGNELVLYDKEGVRVGTETPDWTVLADSIHNAIISYNGQSVWIERDSTTPLAPDSWERIP